MRVLVAGAGAIGQWLGARLQQGGHQATVLLRPRFVDAMRELRVEGHTEFRGPMRCITAPEGEYDAVLLTAKAHATRTLAGATAPLVAQDGVLASLQNGLGNDAKLLAAIEAERASVCLTSHGVHIPEPGRVVHAGTGATHVGPARPGAAGGARIAQALLADAGLAPVWHDDMAGPTWLKAAVNAAINPVAALAGVPNGALADGPLREQAEALAREVFTLSRAAGVDIPDPVPIVQEVVTGTADNRCSMLQDVQAGRPTEIEQITGHMVRLARRLGYPFDRNEAVYRNVKALEAQYLGDDEALRMTREEVDG